MRQIALASAALIVLATFTPAFTDDSGAAVGSLPQSTPRIWPII